MYDVMACGWSGLVLSLCLEGPGSGYPRKGNKWLESEIGVLKRGFVTLPPLKESRPRDLICLLGLGFVGFA